MGREYIKFYPTHIIRCILITSLHKLFQILDYFVLLSLEVVQFYELLARVLLLSILIVSYSILLELSISQKLYKSKYLEW